MARDLTVKARIVAEDAASATVEKVQGRFARLGGFLKSSFVITLGDVTRGLSLLWDAFTFGIKEAAEAEVTLNKFNVALERFGPQTDSVRKSLLAQAEALAATTSATDDEVIAIQTLIANLGAAPDQIERVTAAALDLSAALGVDVSTAATALTKSLEGSGGQLSRMIPQLRDLDSAALRAGAGLAIVEERFGPAAEAQLRTFTGSVGELRQALAELAEAVAAPVAQSGFLLGIIQTLTAVLNTAAGSFTGVADQAKAADPAMAAAAASAQLLAHGASAAAVGMDALAAAELRAARITQEQATAQKDLQASLAAAGVTLRDFDVELERQNQAMVLLDQAYRDGRISIEEYNFAAAQVALNTARITAEMNGASESTEIFTAQLIGLTDAARGARLEVTGLNSSLVAVAASRTGLDGVTGTYAVSRQGLEDLHRRGGNIAVRNVPGHPSHNFYTRPF